LKPTAVPLTQAAQAALASPKLTTGSLKAVIARLRAVGGPDCRQYPAGDCNKVIGPSCAPNLFHEVANWFYIAYGSTSELIPSFALDLTVGCYGFKDLLPPRTQYLASAPTCKYNGGLIPKVPAITKKDMSGVVVAMGVLEQVCDVPSFVDALKSYYLPIVISYAPVLESGAEMPSNRASNYTLPEWRRLLMNLNLTAPRWQASVKVGSATNLLYWFEPDGWLVYTS
jgi:hypothetical protein